MGTSVERMVIQRKKGLCTLIVVLLVILLIKFLAMEILEVCFATMVVLEILLHSLCKVFLINLI